MMRRSGGLGAGLIVWLALGGVVHTRQARAEVVLAKTSGGLEFFSEGRLGGFFEAVTGQTLPTAFDQNGNATPTIGAGGVDVAGLNTILPMGGIGQGTIHATRIRSGFLGNILAFGVRMPLTERVRLSGYISVWADIESENERKYESIYPDAREGYLRIEGPAGTLLVGRSTTLYSRGATEIDFLYGHRYGVGNPAGFNTQGPSGGQVGYGLLANGFGAGVAYATPSLGGFVLTVGYYDPNRFVGLYWDRTQLGRPEGEATYDLVAGKVKLHLFLNGAYQKIYAVSSDRSDTVWGVGAGGRLEISFFHIGIAGHSGQGLGLNYAFDGSDAVVDVASIGGGHNKQLRKFDGIYAQAQVVLGHFDLQAGAGETRVHEVSGDVVVDPTSGLVNENILKDQLGINASVVYHFSEFLHFDADYFRASAQWWLLGQSQVVNTFNAGLTLTW
ncbi:MAG TPA: porin [Polyangia bacterium]|nr:porin [Polyangia bacterium]